MSISSSGKKVEGLSDNRFAISCFQLIFRCATSLMTFLSSQFESRVSQIESESIVLTAQVVSGDESFSFEKLKSRSCNTFFFESLAWSLVYK